MFTCEGVDVPELLLLVGLDWGVIMPILGACMPIIGCCCIIGCCIPGCIAYISYKCTNTKQTLVSESGEHSKVEICISSTEEAIIH